MTRRKFVGFAVAATLLSLLVTLGGLLGADLYLHRRAERSAGLNRWGYRGPTVGRKPSGELRVVMLGGSTVFGYGVTADQSIPAFLEPALNAKWEAQGGQGGRRARVINLGFNNEGAFSFLPTLQDFRFLEYDVVVLYEGYNDLQGDRSPNRAVYRHNSAVFRLTGYFPILPLVLDEKVMVLRFGGDMGAAYAAARGEPAGKTVFRPGLTARATATALETAAAVTNTLGRGLDRLSAEEPPPVASTTQSGCAAPWTHYCESVYVAVRHALDQGQSAVVVAQPQLRGDPHDVHADQRRALQAMVERKFSGNARVAFVDMSTAIDLAQPGAAFDSMHLNPEANGRAAAALVDPIVSVARQRGVVAR